MCYIHAQPQPGLCTRQCPAHVKGSMGRPLQVDTGGCIHSSPMLAEGDDLNSDSPVSQQTLLCHRLHPPHWITETMAQWQARVGVEIPGLEEGQWGYFLLAELGSLEACVSEQCSSAQKRQHNLLPLLSSFHSHTPHRVGGPTYLGRLGV